MMKNTLFLTVSAAALLLACGKSEDVPAPAARPPAAEAPQVMPAPAPVAPVVETPDGESPQSEAAPATQPETQLARPAAASKPVAARAAAAPVESAAKAVDATVPGTPAPDLARGQQIYRQACAFCHDKGVAGAPKTGDAAAWSPRLAQGMDTLHAVALRGKGAMPAKGGNPSLSDADVRAAVDFLVAQSR